MGGYAVFLAPIAGILASDYWLVKKRNIDVPALYDPRGRYRYNLTGINWRALVAFIVPVSPLLPGLAYSINASGVHISAGAQHLYSFDWLFGFVTSILLYTGLSWGFPAQGTLIPQTIFGHEPDEWHDDLEHKGHGASTGNEKGFGNADAVDILGFTKHSHSEDGKRDSTSKKGIGE